MSSTLDILKRTGFILGCENWESFALLIWAAKKNKLYGKQDSGTSGCSCSCPLTGDLTSSACVCGCVVNGISATAYPGLAILTVVFC